MRSYFSLDVATKTVTSITEHLKISESEVFIDHASRLCTDAELYALIARVLAELPTIHGQQERFVLRTTRICITVRTLDAFAHRLDGNVDFQILHRHILDASGW